MVVIEFYPNPLNLEEDEPFEESGSFLDAYFKNLKKLTLLNCVAGSQEWNNIFNQIIVGGEYEYCLHIWGTFKLPITD